MAKWDPLICPPQKNWPTVAGTDSLSRCSDSFATLNSDQIEVEDFGNWMLWSNLAATRFRMYPMDY